MSVIEKARPGGGTRPPRRGGRGRRVALALALVGLAAGGAWFWWGRAQEGVLEPAPPPDLSPGLEAPPLGAGEPQPEGPDEPAASEPEPAPTEPLPALAESDALARELASSVSRSPLLAPAVREAGLVDRFVVVVDQLAEGNTPRRELSFLQPTGAFGVLGREPEQRIDPASYRRYDALAQAIAALDASAAVAAYRRLAPLCEESYRALGYPEGGFEKRLRAALALLVATPPGEDSPALVAQVKRYEFADPELENLSDAQKQLLRTGPKNAARITAKLREIEAALAAH